MGKGEWGKVKGLMLKVQVRYRTSYITLRTSVYLGFQGISSAPNL